jgi:MoaA/NifB/PqqE/SkfB family radical SAM enzyme
MARFDTLTARMSENTKVKNIIKQIERDLKLPSAVQMDASTICQLNCRECYMRTNQKAREFTKIGFLKFKDFKKFIDNNRYISQIELANSGEIFLNPELLDIIKYASRKNVSLSANNGVNFNDVSDEVLESLVKYEFRSIAVSIDGVSQETYAIYRQNGNFNKVINNVKRINVIKEKFKMKNPQMIWKFILFSHSICDIEKAKEMAKELNMKLIFTPAWHWGKLRNDEFETIKDKIIDYGYWPGGDEDTRKIKVCQQMFDNPCINWDGRFLGCCVNTSFGDYGVNVFKEGFKKALRSRTFSYAKGMVQGKLPPPPPHSDNQHIPCAECSLYKIMLNKKDFLK